MRHAFASLTVVLLSAAMGGCAAPQEPTDQSLAEAGAETPPALDLSRLRLVDMSHAYDEDTVYWPTAERGFELQELSYGMAEGGYFYSAYAYSSPEHGGTHLDAPIHFAEDGWTVDEIPLQRLATAAVVIDVSEKAAQDRDYRLATEDVEAWEGRHGTVPRGSTVFLRTGWEQYWPDVKAYLGDDAAGDASNLHFPSYGEEAARLLVEERGVAALGVDTASIDYGPSENFVVHRIANRANVLGLENVANLGELPPRGAWSIALPMKIGGGSGGPVRILGLVPPVSPEMR